MRLQSKLAVEVIIKVGVQPLFRVGGGGGWSSDKMKLVLISTQVEVVVRKSPVNILSRVGGGGWVARSSKNKAFK